MTIVYDQSFDLNELFIISVILVSSLVIWKTPKIFSALDSVAYYLYGGYIGMLFDFVISINPIDFYDINDSSAYQLMDFLTYVMFGAFSYFYIYLYTRLKVRGYMTIVYTSVWIVFAILMELIGLKIGLFHYKNGYSTYYSPPFYLFSQTGLILLYWFFQAGPKRPSGCR